MQVANEPGLGFGGMEGPIKQLLTDTVPPLQAAFRAAGVSANVTVNFIGPNDGGMGDWLAAQVASGAFNASQLLVDFHQVRARSAAAITRRPRQRPPAPCGSTGTGAAT